MATITTDLICNLNQPVEATFLHGNLFSQDNAGNTINVHVMDNGEPATIGGTVSANVIRADGTTVAVSGTIDGNKAYVILPQACYAVPGRIEIIIKLTQSTTITTIAAIVANVYRSTTDTVIDPGTIIPSIQALIEEIENAVDSIPVDYSGLLATIAADYSSSKTYPVAGMYAWQGGVLKRNIVPITTAETYTAAHWTDAVLGDDVSALKSAFITRQMYNPSSADTHIGYRWTNNGGMIATTGYIAVKVDVKEGEKILANAYDAYTFFWTGSASAITYDKYVTGRWGSYAQYTAPSDGSLLVTIAAGNELICMVYEDIFLPDKKNYNHNEIIKVSTIGKPFDFEYAAIGDSITYYDEKDYISTTLIAGSYCKGYQSYIAEKLGFTKVNMGYSGQNSNYMRTQVLATDFSDIDVATIMTGMNDGGQSVPIDTYKQNIIDMILHISTDNPWCRIFLLSPTYGYFDHPQGAYPTGGVTRDYADAMKEVAIAYNIPFFDNMENNGFSYQNYGKYMADKIATTTYAIHPNTEGYKIIGTQIANWMYNLMVND